MTPPSIKPEFKKLCDRVSELHVDWKKHRFLFGDNPVFFELYNAIDPDLFIKIESLFLERICMFLCRLGDPAQQGRNTNLTLDRLRDLAVGEDPSFEAALDAKLREFKTKTSKFRDLRNKLFGHYDLGREMGTDKELFSRRDVEEALLALRNFMNELRICFGENRMLYEEVITHSDGGGLVHALRESTRYRALVRDNKIAHDDLRTWLQDECD